MIGEQEVIAYLIPVEEGCKRIRGLLNKLSIAEPTLHDMMQTLDSAHELQTAAAELRQTIRRVLRLNGTKPLTRDPSQPGQS